MHLGRMQYCNCNNYETIILNYIGTTPQSKHAISLESSNNITYSPLEVSGAPHSIS
jgi:hypothetical protein